MTPPSRKEAVTGRARSITARTVTAGLTRTAVRNHTRFYQSVRFLFSLAAFGMLRIMFNAQASGERLFGNAFVCAAFANGG